MSDFCRQCSLFLFDFDFKDLAGVSEPNYGLCEACGKEVYVDIRGQRLDHSCWVEPWDYKK